jgi:hypothetical protein
MAASEKPIVWVLQGPKTGDNAQARELARRLGFSAVLKPLTYNALHHLPNVLMGASVAHVRTEHRGEISPPWPKLVICTGKRAVPVALWIKNQSGGRTRIVHLGRPRVPLHKIDLVITTPQYGLPLAQNVIERPVPFAAPGILPESERETWLKRFTNLPRPWTGVLAGGQTYALRFDDKATLRLSERIKEVRGQGSVLLSTSPRTGVTQARQLASLIPPPSYVHVFGEGENPHQAILALADRFIVTSDSMSMLAEVAETGRPFEVFELPRSPFALSWQARSGLGGWLARKGLISPPRDFRKVPRTLQAINDQKIFERTEKLMQEP